MNRTNYHTLLNLCKTLKSLQHLHAQALVRGLHPHHQPLSCRILNAYAALGAPADARKVFAEIPDPDLVSLTSVISLHLQFDEPRTALSLFSELVSSGRTPDGFAVVGALTAAAWIGHVGFGKSVHGLVCRFELGQETVVGNALIVLYSKLWKFEAAQQVFDGMRVRDPITWSSLLHGCVKCVGLDSALKLFDEMPQRDVVSWTVMITGHVQGKQPVRALELFRMMKSDGHHPTQITLVGVISACADIGALDLGRAIHCYVNKLNVGSDLTVYNALIDAYAKSGNLEAAFAIFKEIPFKDVFTYTSMISGFAVHGNGKRAMELFFDMRRSGVRPNAVTFLSLLTACSHGGLIREGREWFDIMCREYNINPQIEHFGCMVDLLGRAGLLTEAEDLIKTMGVEPDAVIWRSLLSACLVHGNDKLAEIAGKEIIKREPGDDGVYALLWNMYASSNRWGDALELRKKMRNRNIFKKPGCSWIEVDGFVHEFLADDTGHCRRGEVYFVLECLAKQLKIDQSVFSLEEDGNVRESSY